MRKVLTTSGLALVAVAALWLLVPADTEAICICPSGPPQYATPVHWGHGADCTEAKSDLRSQTMTYARNDCGGMPCNTNLVVTFCGPSGNGYVADGYLEYSCRDECGPLVP